MKNIAVFLTGQSRYNFWLDGTIDNEIFDSWKKYIFNEKFFKEYKVNVYII